MLRDDEGCFAACMNWLLGDTAAWWRRFVPFCHMAHANSPVGPVRGRAWIDAETGKAEDGPPGLRLIILLPPKSTFWLRSWCRVQTLGSGVLMMRWETAACISDDQDWSCNRRVMFFVQLSRFWFCMGIHWDRAIPFAGPGQARIPNLQLLTGYGLLGLQLLQIYADLVCAVCWSWTWCFCLALCWVSRAGGGVHNLIIRYVHTLGWLVWFQCWATCTASSYALWASQILQLQGLKHPNYSGSTVLMWLASVWRSTISADPTGRLASRHFNSCHSIEFVIPHHTSSYSIHHTWSGVFKWCLCRGNGRGDQVPNSCLAFLFLVGEPGLLEHDSRCFCSWSWSLSLSLWLSFDAWLHQWWVD